ncbi:putative transcriptional regulator, TetR [Mycobacteroides abscessus subsp. abscessus]|uniref:TetR/AcrR family transcriptional regulator n=1 Tax=Mycobacteroides abscessus TaxID=36809 RepID=UPI00092B5D8B|nr:TetR/AcrR family transcriptional regulator [Mycobacteroides abscessus]SIH36784.1 putative transcriptional regulator, TetR [Mycobacteroides abscessus subsp. abscessus]
MGKHHLDRGRRNQILDAAVQLLGSGGDRATTFHGVEQAAGVPRGTASNHFRNRETLLITACDEIEQRRLADWATRIPTDTPPRTAQVLTKILSRYITAATKPNDPTSTLARAHHALSALAISSHLALRERLNISAHLHRSHLHRALQAISPGASDLHARMICDYLDGVIAGQLAAPQQVLDPYPGVAALLAMLHSATAAKPVR